LGARERFHHALDLAAIDAGDLASGACRSGAGLKPAPTSLPICALYRESETLWAPTTSD
jgi:hypothetical protein